MQEILFQHSFNLNSILFLRIFLESFNFASFYITKLSFTAVCKNKMLKKNLNLQYVLCHYILSYIDVIYFAMGYTLGSEGSGIVVSQRNLVLSTGTDVHSALINGIKKLMLTHDSKRSLALLFLTDGQANSGKMN